MYAFLQLQLSCPTCPWVTLSFSFTMLSRGIDILLVCLCPLDLITLGILLGELYYTSVRLQIILFDLRTANKLSIAVVRDSCARLVSLS
jgi:hypothetical protein